MCDYTGIFKFCFSIRYLWKFPKTNPVLQMTLGLWIHTAIYFKAQIKITCLSLFLFLSQFKKKKSSGSVRRAKMKTFYSHPHHHVSSFLYLWFWNNWGLHCRQTSQPIVIVCATQVILIAFPKQLLLFSQLADKDTFYRSPLQSSSSAKEENIWCWSITLDYQCNIW